MSVIIVPKPLRDKLGEEATDAFVEVMREVDLSARQEAILIAEERLERRLTEEIGNVNERITYEIGKVNERLTAVEKTLENMATKADIKELEGKIIGLDLKMNSLELRLTVKLGALVAAGIAVVSVLVKLL